MTRDELKHILVHTKHGPDRNGGDGPCRADCIKCWVQRQLEELDRLGPPAEPPQREVSVS